MASPIDNTLTLTGTAEANSTVKVFDGATLLGSGNGERNRRLELHHGGACRTAPTASPRPPPMPPAMTGAASAALSVTVDTAAPAAPSIASFSTDSGTVGDGITNDNTLTLTGTAEANATVKVFDGATLLGSVSANGSGAWSYTTAALANGAHSLTATATDAAGNTGAASAALSVTIDTTAPVAPSIASFSTDSGTVGDGITNDNTLTLTGTAEANATVKVFDGATLLGSATANGSGAWSYTTAALANGAHSLTATATDAAGNTGAASAALSVTIDTTAPVAPSIASFSTDSGTVGDGITNDNTLTLTGTAEANSTVKVFDGATLLGSATANGSGRLELYDGGARQWRPQPDRHRHRCRRQYRRGLGGAERDHRHDGAGCAEHCLVLDRQRHGWRRHHQRQYADADRHGGSQQQRSRSSTAPRCSAASPPTAAAPGAITTAALANGAHSLTATATDAAGNTGVASAALGGHRRYDRAGCPEHHLVLDRQRRRSAMASPIDNTLTLTGTAEANSTVKVFDGATLLGSAPPAEPGPGAYTTAALCRWRPQPDRDRHRCRRQ